MIETSPREHIQGSMQTKGLLLNDEKFYQTLDQSIAVISDSMRRGGKLLICGNGGSAADAQHIAAELTSMLDLKMGHRPGLPALALTTDTSFITACSNDFSFGGIFARQVQSLGNNADVLLGISTSGNSENVILAVEQAKSLEITTISLTGHGGGKLKSITDININVPSQKTQWIQESHIMIGHMICYGVEVSVYPLEDRNAQ